VELDDELCLCFHVTRRKVENYVRLQRPLRVSQLSECHGAGTGCGWCRPFLARIWEQFQSGEGPVPDLPVADDYAQARADYVRAGKGNPPPGATPLP
jgi:NAD(P)H-nitrite reductase large subunit